MNKKYIISFFVLLILALGGVFLYKKLFQPKAIHFHAGFQVYIDGNLQDYSDQKYMSLLPCGKLYQDASLEQQEKAHLHNQVGDVVHVHRVGATWSDLFINMRVHLDTSKPIVGYVNGKEVSNILHQPIHPFDRAIILIGQHGSMSDYIKRQVTIAHILKIERGAFEDCGTNPN